MKKIKLSTKETGNGVSKIFRHRSQHGIDLHWEAGKTHSFHLHVDIRLYLSSYTGMALGLRDADIDLNLFVISVNEGRAGGSDDQHCSISFFHSGSQWSGRGGLSVFLTIPPAFMLLHQTRIICTKKIKSRN